MAPSKHSRPEARNPSGDSVSERPGLGPEPASDPTDSAQAARRLVAMREHTLVSLFELSQDLSISLDLFSVADLVLFNVMGQFGTSRSAMWMVSDQDPRVPILIRSHGVPRHMARALGAVCTALVVQHFTKHPRPMSVSELEPIVGLGGPMMLERAEIQLFAPILARKEVLGVVALGPRIGGEPYGELEFDSLQTSLSMVGVAIENMSLYNRMLENNRQLRNANDELTKLDRLKSEFLSNVNHELRTPLTCIIAYVDSLLEVKPSREQYDKFLGIVMQEALKLKGLLENLLTFAAASQNRLQVTRMTGDVSLPLARYCDERIPGVSECLRELVWRCEARPLIASYDEQGMIQVVDALVENAVKFTTEGSRIELRASLETRDETSWIRIDVEDDGPGIPADKLPTLFDSFRQGDGSSTRTVGGMGIGLAMAKHLATAMGGRLSVTSEIGKGSDFTLLLPAA